MEPLSKAQKKIYDTLRSYITDLNYVPTHKELMQALGYKSTSSIATGLVQLKEKGWIDWPKRHRRAIRLLPIIAECNSYIPTLINTLKQGNETSEDVIMKGLQLLQEQRCQNNQVDQDDRESKI